MQPRLFPFVWSDVAVVHIACAIPLAWLLCGLAGRKLRPAGMFAAAVTLLGLSVVPMLLEARESILATLIVYPSLGFFLRTAVALGLALCFMLVVRTAPLGQGSWRQVGEQRATRAPLVCAAVAAFVLPGIYVAARSGHDLARLGEYMAQSRIAEARSLARGLLALDAGRQLNGRSLPQVAGEIELASRELEAVVAVPLTSHATANERLDRARTLAMLGQADAAINVLQTVADPTAAPEAALLLATICEHQSQWQAALEAYTTAREAWQSQRASASQAEGLLQATKGIAYAQRKLGQYDRAAATYQQLLAMSPTAESHFLLAQFYEDSQDAGQARAHARRAMALAPEAYQSQGQRLIDKLVVHQFGCLGVQRAERPR